MLSLDVVPIGSVDESDVSAVVDVSSVLELSKVVEV
jgi:hypothetical protein